MKLNKAIVILGLFLMLSLMVSARYQNIPYFTFPSNTSTTINITNNITNNFTMNTSNLVPYTGATSNVDLGYNDLDTYDFIQDGLIISPYYGVGIARNYFTYTEDFTNSAWIRSSGVNYSANIGFSPIQDATAEKLVNGTIGSNIRYEYTTASTGLWDFAIWLKSDVDTPTIHLVLNSTSEVGVTKDITLSTQWKRYDVLFNSTINPVKLNASIIFDDNVIYLWGAQLDYNTSLPRKYVYRSSGAQTTDESYFLIRGALRAISSINSDGSITSSSSMTSSRSNITTTSTDGFVAQVTQSSNSQYPNQYTPRFRYSGTVFNTTKNTSLTYNFIQEGRPVSSANPVSFLYTAYNINNSAYRNLTSIDSNGNLNISNNTYTSLPSAELWFDNDSTQLRTISVSNTWYNISFNTSTDKGNFTNGFTIYNGTSLVCFDSGLYDFRYSISMETAGTNKEYNVALSNGTLYYHNTETHTKLGTTGDVLTIADGGYIRCSPNLNISLVVRQVSGIDNVGIHQAHLNVLRIGN